VRQLLLLAAALLGCQPAFDRRPSVIDGPRILAVQSVPAEAKVGTAVQLSTLAVDPTGVVAGPAVDWAFCVSPRPVAEYDTVSAKCFASDSMYLQAVPPSGDAFSAPATLPASGCALFGSEPLPPGPGDPPVRPADPDGTGGYYQPVRVDWAGVGPVALGEVRLSCALPQAPLSVTQQFRDQYTLNLNPSVPDLSLEGGASEAVAGTAMQVTARWTAQDAEPYVAYDVATSTLEDRTELLRVSWFATAGELATDVTEVAGGDTSATQTWTAPMSAGPAHLWVVLRDDRGGSSWQHLSVNVR
jgi:hypothetical protein